MNELFIPVFVALVLPSYFIWRYWSALNLRGKVVSDVDDYLGGDHPEEMKQMVFHSFNDCLSVTLPFRVMFTFIFSVQRGKDAMNIIKEQFGEHEFNSMISIFIKVFMVNVSRSPLSVLVCSVVILTVAIVRLVFLSMTIPRLANRFENALLRVVV